MARYIPTKCKTCKESHYGINGRYCERYKIYVAYRRTPLCEEKNEEKRKYNSRQQ